MSNISKEMIIEAIKDCAKKLGRAPSRIQFYTETKISEFKILSHFDSWRDALDAAGLKPHTDNSRIEEQTLLESWGFVVRKLGKLPTIAQYRKHGEYSDSSFRRFGKWTIIPQLFRQFASDKIEWADVLKLLPDIENLEVDQLNASEVTAPRSTESNSLLKYSKLSDRPSYGDPIDFRGLRHSPVNEQGVVFLFGMVAKELGYSVEAVQTGFPDCEAKRQISKGKWQRVRIEFEFESRNFRDHGHRADDCDVVVCWIHNWPDIPRNLEVLELKEVIESLPR